MLSIYVILILIEYVSIKYNAWNMEVGFASLIVYAEHKPIESEINKLKEVIENERKESVVYREVGKVNLIVDAMHQPIEARNGVQSYNYRSMS